MSWSELTATQQRVVLTVAMLLLWLALVTLMLRSRRRRRRGDAEIPQLPPVPAGAGADLVAPVVAECLGTTRAGDWLRRVDVGLPERSIVTARVTPAGVAIDPPGLLIPAGAIRGAHLDEAHGGKVVGEGGVVVVTWDAGDHELETGFRARDRARHPEWMRAVRSLAAGDAAPEPAPGSGPGSAPSPATFFDQVEKVTDTAGAGGAGGGIGAPALVGRAAAPALLVLEDGRLFRGEAYGTVGETFGEAVFNTGMTGYQETLTDPSYHRQVVAMTAPHIGNTGVNDVDPESTRIWVAGYVVRDPSPVASNWRATGGLEAELKRQGVVGISGVDTRALTRHLRERGAMRCAVSSTGEDADTVLAKVVTSPDMAGADLAREVTTPGAYVVPATTERRFRVVAVDLGLKRSITAYLAAQGCEVHVLPATATAEEILATDLDGVFLSNGPGDPAATGYAVDALRGVLGHRPVFGICLGHQMLGLALGLGTYKLRFGHRGVNQPVQDLDTRQVAITSHNHGFAVAAPEGGGRELRTEFGQAVISHVDLNDGVVEGLRCLEVPAFSVQYHPEAAPGPHDATGLFARFAELMRTTGVPR